MKSAGIMQKNSFFLILCIFAGIFDISSYYSKIKYFIFRQFVVPHKRRWRMRATANA